MPIVHDPHSGQFQPGHGQTTKALHSAEHKDLTGKVLSQEPHPVLTKFFQKPMSLHEFVSSMQDGEHFKVHLASNHQKEGISIDGDHLVFRGVIAPHGHQPRPEYDHEGRYRPKTDHERENEGQIVRKFSYKDDQFGSYSQFPGPNRTLEVDHNFLSLPKSVQGKGGGSEHLRNAMAFYEKHGVKKITLEAGLDAGRYVWARMGFEASAASFKAYKSEFVKHVEQLAGAAEAKRVKAFKQMHEIADYKTPDGQRAGKEFLLNATNVPGANERGQKSWAKPWRGSVTHGEASWERLKTLLHRSREG